MIANFHHRRPSALGRLLTFATGCNRPILLKKSVYPNCLIIDW